MMPIIQKVSVNASWLGWGHSQSWWVIYLTPLNKDLVSKQESRFSHTWCLVPESRRECPAAAQAEIRCCPVSSLWFYLRNHRKLVAHKSSPLQGQGMAAYVVCSQWRHGTWPHRDKNDLGCSKSTNMGSGFAIELLPLCFNRRINYWDICVLFLNNLLMTRTVF